MAVFFLIIILLTRGGMGWGDLTLGIMIGSFLGFKLSLITLVFSFIIGAIAGLILIVLRKKGRKDAIPFGPFLSISAFVASIYGYRILEIYYFR
jgi:leader peptidase (prepilin peptidase)/N-methyltransferase